MARLYILFPVALYLTLLLHAACVTADDFEGELRKFSDDNKGKGINAHQKFSIFGSHDDGGGGGAASTAEGLMGGVSVGRKFSKAPPSSGGDGDSDSGSDGIASGLPPLASLGGGGGGGGDLPPFLSFPTGALPPLPPSLADLGRDLGKNLGKDFGKDFEKALPDLKKRLAGLGVDGGGLLSGLGSSSGIGSSGSSSASASSGSSSGGGSSDSSGDSSSDDGSPASAPSMFSSSNLIPTT